MIKLLILTLVFFINGTELESKENPKHIIHMSYQVLCHTPTIGPGPKSAALDGSY